MKDIRVAILGYGGIARAHMHGYDLLEQEGLLSAHGTNGRFVTEDEQVLQDLRQARIKALALEYAQKFAVLGLSPTQAAQEILGLERTNQNG